MARLLVFCVFLQLLRVQYTQSLFFSFLIWNLFLAFIPYSISELLKMAHLSKTTLCLSTIPWLLCLPNAPYIITDFVHLHHSKKPMLYYDIFMLFSFATTGLTLGVVSLNTLYQLFLKHYHLRMANRFRVITVILTGFGIYLGRFLRFNTWDIFTQPISLLKQSLNSLTDSNTWYIILGYALLLYLLHVFFRSYHLEKTP